MKKIIVRAQHKKMASQSHPQILLVLAVLTAIAATSIIPINAQLTSRYYQKVCPHLLPLVRSAVGLAIDREPRMGASLLRLHFHDCFVNGCDGSVLLDDTSNFTGEKNATPNKDSLRGFEVVDEIKAAVEKACPSHVVSCADILAIAARDSVAILGGPSLEYEVLLGRRDATTTSQEAANTNLPLASASFSELLSNFQSHGLDLKDLVALSGGHTIGFARCSSFRDRIYNDTNIDPNFAASMQKICPQSGSNDNLAPFDSTSRTVDTAYYYGLLQRKGLLHSDQELFKGSGCESDKLVQLYSTNPLAFAKDFAASMIKMGNMNPLTGNDGEIRLNCRRVNN